MKFESQVAGGGHEQPPVRHRSHSHEPGEGLRSHVGRAGDGTASEPHRCAMSSCLVTRRRATIDSVVLLRSTKVGKQIRFGYSSSSSSSYIPPVVGHMV